MLKTLLEDKKKREALKEQVEVVFAVFTIASFVVSRVQKRKEADGEGETENCQSA